MTESDHPGQRRRFRDILIKSGGIGELVTEVLQEYALVRRLLFAALILLFWGNTSMMLGIACVWALYEAIAFVAHWWRQDR